MGGNEPQFLSQAIQKINLTQIIDLTIKANTIKLPEENIEEYLHDFWQVKVSTKRTPSERKMIDKLGFIKVKNSHSSKVTVKKMKRQATHWKKIFTIHMSDKVLVYKIHKELI